MADRFDEGMVMTWSGKWHWPASPVTPSRFDGTLTTLCGHRGFSSRKGLISPGWHDKYLDDPDNPICKRCITAKEKLDG